MTCHDCKAEMLNRMIALKSAINRGSMFEIVLEFGKLEQAVNEQVLYGKGKQDEIESRR